MQPVDGPLGLPIAEAVRLSLPADSDEALVALTHRLALAIDAAEDPADLDRLSGRLLACLRELGWTPATRGDDDDDEQRPEWARAMGGASIRDASRPIP
jgi:hypothetical protein